jgi:hypothetical protein
MAVFWDRGQLEHGETLRCKATAVALSFDGSSCDTHAASIEARDLIEALLATCGG